VLPASEVARKLLSDTQRGLASAAAFRRMVRYGPNRLAEARGRSPLAILIDQLRSLVVLLLISASAIAFALGENIEAAAILIVIVLNAIIGFLTEWRAERALTALQKQTVAMAQVVRDGATRHVPAAELVPGDLVVLAAGARVPADGRIVEAARLQIEEAALTGESQAVFKRTEPVPDSEAPLGDRSSMAFMGTIVTDGRGRILVTATGMRTEVGRIGALIEGVRSRETPLEQKLDRLGRVLVVIVLVLCTVIVFTGWLRGIDLLHMVEVGISLAIAAVPEGLPAVATLTLAVGMQRMARMRAIVRRLPAVEALGSVTVICTDKTGTLTKNEMTVCTLVVDDRRIEVTGSGFQPKGQFLEDGRTIEPGSDSDLCLALRIGALCNDARINRSGEGETVLGDPTEAALLVAAEKASMAPVELHRDFPRINEIPFDSQSRRMLTVHRTRGGGIVAYVKGSPGKMLDLSSSRLAKGGLQPLTEQDRERFRRWNSELAGEALRVLGIAYRELPEDYSQEDLDRELVLVGMVGMIDPLREEVKDAIAVCRGAGIRTVMITGDQPPTAAEIGRQLGLDRDAQGRFCETVHARELDDLNHEGWRRIVSQCAVFARVSPKHKLQIVEALQQQGEIVAMTGDGVNDAPSLKQADVGVAMGIKGTEVAKETADIIITDDNFATIVAAVEQGRIIYANILKFIHYLFSCNFAEILVVFVAILIGLPLPLGPLQILWLNMITDIFPALALAMEPSAPDMMRRPPRDPREGLINREFLSLVGWQGVLIATVTLISYVFGLHWHGTEQNGLRRASTMAFLTLALAQVAHAFNARSQMRSVFTDRLFTNGWLWAAVIVCLVLQVASVTVPLLRRVLHTAPPSASEWAIITTCSLAPVVIVELIKAVIRRARSLPPYGRPENA
jgi:P-type Ca2+ transporter type 2C